jgi:hypothetical protein
MIPIEKMLLNMARFYNYELEKRQLEMYVNVLQQFPETVVMRAGQDYMRDIKNTRFPIPPHSILKDYLPQKPDQKDLAREAASRVIAALSKFGAPNGSAAKEYIGELGWMAVQRHGGWLVLCETTGNGFGLTPPTMLQAQIRDLCESTQNLAAAGIHDQPIGLPEAKASRVLDIVKTLAEKKAIEPPKEEL